VKKLFSLALVLVLITSMAALVGCNGLWGFDDDDDVVGPVGTKFSLSGAVEIPGDGIDSNGNNDDNTNLRAVKVSDGLKAEVWKKVAGKADERVHVGDVSSEGKYTLEFFNSPAYFYIRIVRASEFDPANPLAAITFKMLVVLGTLTEAKATQTDVAITPTTTAVAILMEKAKADTTVDPVTFANDSANADGVTVLSNDITTKLVAGVASETVNIDEIADSAKLPVTSVALNKKTTTMSVGTNETLVATINPSFAASSSAPVWASDNTTYATVSDAGVVTPLQPTPAGVLVNITYTFNGYDKSGNNVSFADVCAVTVIQPVTSVELTPPSLNLFIGNESTLIAKVSPENASNKTITWASSNESVASVVDGKVTAKAVGVATITVTTQDGNKSATCGISVAAVPVPIKAISLNPTSLTVEMGKTGTLAVVYDPVDANTQTKVEWVPANANIATVNNGVVTPVAVGSTEITVTVTDKDNQTFTAKAAVEVKAAPKPAQTKVTLTKPVSGANLLGVKIVISKGTASTFDGNSFTTMTTLSGKYTDSKGNVISGNYDLEKEPADSDADNASLLYPGILSPIPVLDEFNELNFTVAIPGGCVVKVIKTSDGSTLAESNNL